MSVFDISDDHGWQASANCSSVDPELFYPEKGANNRAAKQVCDGCAVKAVCLVEAMEARESFGIRGGLSARERSVLWRSGWRPGDPLPPVRGLSRVGAA